jgi:hypothetical protein
VVAKENLIPPIPEVPLYTLSGIKCRSNHILHDITLVENSIEQFEWPYEPFAWGWNPVYKAQTFVSDVLTNR